MPSIDDQLRAFARRLDDAVVPVRADEVVPVRADAVVVPEAVLVSARAKRSRGTVVAAAIALAAAIVIASIVVVGDRGTTRRPVAGLRTTAASTTSSTIAPTPIAWTDGPAVDIGATTLAVYTESSQVVLAVREATLLSLTGKVLVAVGDAHCRGIASVSNARRTIDITLRPSTGIGCGAGGGAPSLLLQRSGLPRGVVTFAVVGGPSLSIDLDRPGGFAVVGDETGGVAPCVMSRSPDGSGALVQPATITLPSGNTFAIRPGNPNTAPNDVTLDGDGSAPGTVSDPSVVGGQAANSLLWGAATPNGPFADLDHVAVGSTITLDQTQPSPCTQDWRVVSIGSPDAQNGPTSRPSLTLVGFQPTNGGGPNVLFYVDAVPA